MRRYAGRVARHLFYDLRREYPGPTRDALAIGVGAFIGCLPLYGLHLLLTILAGRVLKLNRLKMYAAANISNPLMAPALLLAEVETGAWLRRGDLHDLTLSAMREVDPRSLGVDLLLGSVCVGAVIGVVSTLMTLAVVRSGAALPAHVNAVFAAAADRYVDTTMTAWEFARGKLRGDYVYGALLTGILPSGATFVDIGCGQGLTLATIVEARRLYTTGQWPASTSPPPTFDRLLGIEMRQRVASIARAALGSDAEIAHAQAPEALPQEISSAALFDVLHLMPYEDQETLLDAIAARMPTGAVLLVRDANANAGSRFRWVRIGNRIKAIAVGRWRQRFFFRDADGWQELFSRHGWRAETVSPVGTVNVLFRLTKA